MQSLDQDIHKAQHGGIEAMVRLFKQFDRLLKKQANMFHHLGLEYDDAYQQAALLFIMGVYQYEKRPPVTFAGFIKKRIQWGLWMYWRKQR